MGQQMHGLAGVVGVGCQREDKLLLSVVPVLGDAATEQVIDDQVRDA
jgi:hypothetical protein